MNFNLDRGSSSIAIAGNPNVGKSVVFNSLTGRYAVVSNYPGTTVEVMRGKTTVAGVEREVVDTPGLYSLMPITDEERVARRLLLGESPGLVLHVADAKNLERMLAVTIELIELGRPTVLLVNMMDEARRLGIELDADALGRELGLTVVTAAATERHGLDGLRAALEITALPAPKLRVDYGPLEPAIAEIVAALPERLAAGARGLALLLLQADEELSKALWDVAPKAAAIAARHAAPEHAYAIATRRLTFARDVLSRHQKVPRGQRRTFADRLHDLTVRPLTGVPILLLIVYFGLYRFVGVFGAGDVVDFLENDVFGAYVNPWVNHALAALFPGGGWHVWARDLVGGEYGVITLGVAYAIAIILPLVSLFFLFFSILEDSGYFPRLALLADRVFRRIGLNGRAVIPLVLGFGCGTMATMVTRVQETKRERVLTTILLAVAIPCSAQYGVVTGLLASQPASPFGVSWAFLGWASIMMVAFILTGRVASRFVKGPAASFYMELPPLRVPRLGNVVAKTLARMRWYFLEVLPLFILVSLFIWVGRLTRVFDLAIAALTPLVRLIGLPSEAAAAFLFGFFRRDFGAAGLFDLQHKGLLDGRQLLVACVTITLFLPCVAQVMVMKKERGLKMTLATAAGVFAGAFLVGGLVNLAIVLVGVLS